MGQLKSSFESNPEAWKNFYDQANPQDHPMPQPFEKESDRSMGRLVILRCVRPDKLVPAIRKYVVSRMGQFFVEPPPFDLRDSYDDSSNVTPLVFVLSPGKRLPIVRTVNFVSAEQ